MTTKPDNPIQVATELASRHGDSGPLSSLVARRSARLWGLLLALMGAAVALCAFSVHDETAVPVAAARALPLMNSKRASRASDSVADATTGPAGARVATAVAQSIGSESAHTAADSDETSLRIRVSDIAGRPVTSGTLTCVSAERANVELADDALVQTVAITAEETSISVPGDHQEALLTAATDRGAPKFARATDLRRVEGQWIEFGRVVRQVDVRLDATERWPSIVGVVSMDDRGPLPRGLSVKFQPASFHGGRSSRAVVAAALDPRNGEYSVVLEGSGSGYLVLRSVETSLRMVEVHAPAATAGDSPLRLDIELGRGESFEIELRDESGGLAIDHPLSVELTTVCQRIGTRVSYASRRVDARTDMEGVAHLEHVPALGRIRVLDGHGAGTELVLAEAALDALPARAGHGRQLNVTLVAATGRLWGRLSSATENQARTTVVVERAGLSATIEVEGDGSWSTGELPAGEYCVRALRRGSIITLARTVTLAAGAEVGPLVLDPLPSATVEWRTEREARCVWIEIERDGEWRECLRREQPPQSDLVEVLLPDQAPVDLRCGVVLADGVELVRMFRGTSAGAFLRAELELRDTVEVRLRCDGRALDAAATVEFRELPPWAGPSERIATSRRVDSTGARIVSLSPGRYLYRVRGVLPQFAFLGTLVIAGGAPNRSIELDWTGTHGPDVSLAPVLEVTHCDGIDLSAIPPEFRSFAASAGSSTCDPLFWRCPSGSRWIVRQSY